MTFFTPKRLLAGLGAAALLTACSRANVGSPTSDSAKSGNFEYTPMDGFSQDMASFIGLTVNESFSTSEAKINAVFKAYDGQAAPRGIAMKSENVEGGWNQVLVTQDGVTDNVLAGQQLLAIFDDEQKLVTYGVRIKCRGESAAPAWQNTPCG